MTKSIFDSSAPPFSGVFASGYGARSGCEAQEGNQVHLIQSDLWEAITGEHLSPENICRLCGSISAKAAPAPTSVSDQFYHMAKDRQGCRYLQQKIEECSQKERELIANNLMGYLDELVFDQCSNYVIQKLCEYLPDSAQKKFLNFFLTDLGRIIEHQYSCRVLQKFLEHTSKENVNVIYQTIKNSLILICLSPNGNHIVQRFIEILPDRIGEMVDIIKPHVGRMVVDNCGCRVIQKLFDTYPLEELRVLVDEILLKAKELATNQYGNYIVQYILESGSDADFAALLREYKGSFFAFSIHKFASNVIEKCIRRANIEQRNDIFNEIICISHKFHAERISQLVGDKFGNYVIQRIIEFGREEQQNAIFEVVFNNFNVLSNISFAKHVITRLKSLGYVFD